MSVLLSRHRKYTAHWRRNQSSRAPKISGVVVIVWNCRKASRENGPSGAVGTPHTGYAGVGCFFFRPYSWRAPTVSNRAFFPPGISPVTAKLGGSTTCAQPSGLAERGVRLPTVLHTHTCRRRRCSRRSMWWGMSWGGGRWWRTRGRRVSRLRDTLDRGTTVLA